MAKSNPYEGQVLDGRYRVERLLGEGGMGAVYEGRHVLVGKRVAIKLLHAEYATSEEVLKRFYREAQSAAAIGHKNIIDIYDVGVTSNNEPYIAMEYLEGEDLESLLEREKKVSVEAACGILEPALLALEAAHAKGIVHRDLKPANIFLLRSEDSSPVVKLIDFGISKVTGTGGTKLTQTGSLLGTPAYMSPEQARGDADVDHRSDIYSMGVILFQMLTGELPFQGAHYNELLINVLTSEPRSMRELEPSIPAEVEALVYRELSKDRRARSSSARALLGDLQTLAAYSERESGLSLLGTRIRADVASGDLGKTKGGSGVQSSASKVLSQMARTPGVWAGTAAKRKGRRMLWGGIAAGALVAGAVAVYLALVPAPGERALAPGPSAGGGGEVLAPAAEDGVQITVQGMPEGARIIYDGARIPENPFRVKRSSLYVPLRVEADGFEPFTTSVVPEADRIVLVEVKPVAAVAEPAAPVVVEEGAKARADAGGKKKPGTKTAEAAPPSAEPATVEVPVPKKPGGSKKIADGRKGTKFSEDFE
ncbi:MAG TPA: serine/threonine-protein kinase [Polyangia bacterium]|nr:serine/threonine-protein kinase [Polyangia bacterium]